MLLQRVATCMLTFPMLLGCDQAKGILQQPDLSCDVAQKPKSFELVDDDAYLACRTLWPKKLGAIDGEPWLARLLFNPDPVASNARQGFSAVGRPFGLACEKGFIREADREALAEYRNASAAFFRAYFKAPANPSDDGMMVFLAGIAPADAGERVVLGAMSAFNDPTEKASAERDRRSGVTQLLKAAFFYNAAADRVAGETRYMRKHGRLKAKPADILFAREQLKRMKHVMGYVRPEALKQEKAQLELYNALLEASKSLRARVR